MQVGRPAAQLADVAQNHHGPSRQLFASRMKRKRDKSRVYRRNTFLEKKLEESRLRLEMYRKRWLRLKGKSKTKGAIETPRSKTRRLLRDASSSYVKSIMYLLSKCSRALIKTFLKNPSKKSSKAK